MGHRASLLIKSKETDLEDISSVLIADDIALEVEAGDVVRHGDLEKPQDILTVQITNGKDDFEDGVVNEGGPLAQALFNAVIGGEVTLHLFGTKAKVFQIVEIGKSKEPSWLQHF